jgi:hypothetical protein
VVEEFSQSYRDEGVNLSSLRCLYPTDRHPGTRLAGDGVYNLRELGLEGRLVKIEFLPNTNRVTLYSERDGKGRASPVYTSTVCFEREGWPVGKEAFVQVREDRSSRPPTPSPRRVVNTQLAEAQARAAALTRARLTAGTAAVEAGRSPTAGRSPMVPGGRRLVLPTWGQIAKSIKIETLCRDPRVPRRVVPCGQLQR